MMAVQLIEHIQAAGLKEEGILRIPGSVTRVKVCGCVLSNNLHYNVVFFWNGLLFENFEEPQNVRKFMRVRIISDISYKKPQKVNTKCDLVEQFVGVHVVKLLDTTSKQ